MNLRMLVSALFCVWKYCPANDAYFLPMFAEHIKVNMDRAQEPIKLEALKAGKNLYVPPARDAEIPSIFTQVLCPEDADIKTQKKIARLQGEAETKKEIGIDTDIKLDLLIVGSCAVSKTGQRIGKGNGYVDLDVGLLSHLNVVTKDTIIITTVHDVQVIIKYVISLFIAMLMYRKKRMILGLFFSGI